MDRAVYGIEGYSIYLPEKKISAFELSEIWNIPEDVIREKIGICEKGVGQKQDHAIQMTLTSAKKCLEVTNTQPQDIDLVIYNGEDYKEYFCYTVAIKVIKELNLNNAWGFDIGYRCTATVLGIKLATDIMNNDSSINTVLICGGNTSAYLVDENDKSAAFMLPLSVGACSLLIKRNIDYRKILGSCFDNNSKFADYATCRHAATEDPRRPGLSNNSLWRFTYPDNENMKKLLRQEAVDYIVNVAKKAVKLSNLQMNEIDYVALTHINRKAHEQIMHRLGIEKNKTVYLDHYGHIGHVDNIVSIEEGLKNNIIKKGSYVLMIAIGIGYSYGAMVIAW